MKSISCNQITLIEEGELVIKDLQLRCLERMAERGSHPLVTRTEITGSDDHGWINPLIHVRRANTRGTQPEARSAGGGGPVPRVEPRWSSADRADLHKQTQDMLMETKLHREANGQMQRVGVSIQEKWPFSKQVNRKKAKRPAGLRWASRGWLLPTSTCLQKMLLRQVGKTSYGLCVQWCQEAGLALWPQEMHVERAGRLRLEL